MTTKPSKARALIVTAGAALLIGLGAGPAAASSEPPAYGPEWDPGQDHSNFEPGPDHSTFEPGAAPGTADLVDDTVAEELGGLLGRLFG